MKLDRFQEEVDGEASWDFGKLYVQHATVSDARPITERLRTADRNELSATSGEPPLRVLVDGIQQSTPCFTVKITATGEPCGIFGTRDSGHPESGVVWLHGTDDLVANRLTFLRHSRMWLNELHKKYRLLWNVIDARNELHLTWLDWLGFDFVEEIEKYGVERRPFILFRRYHV